MSGFFSKPDSKDQMRQNDRALRRTNRDLEKDRRQLERQEKQLEGEIRKLAKQGNKEACAVLAKQLVNVRKQKAKSHGMSAKVTGINAQTKTMYSTSKMGAAIKTTAETMNQVNKQINPQQLAKTMQEFEKAGMTMEMSDDLVNETLDNMLEESGDEAEQESIVNKVLDEIGIDIKSQLSKAPAPSASITEPATSSEKTKDVDIERMLARLR